jgi:hypothetical protein
MPAQFWESLIDATAPWTAAGTTWSTVTTIGDVSPQPDFTFPANWWYPGACLRIRANGHMNTSATATNLTMALYWGATNTAGVLSSGTVLSTTGAVPMAATAITGAPWLLESYIQCRTVGATGTFATLGFFKMVATGGLTLTDFPMPLNTWAVVTVSTAAATTLALGATISQVTGAPSVTCDHWLLEALN